MNRIKMLTMLALAMALQACSGVISYSRNDIVFAGPLGESNLNQLNKSTRISAMGSADRMAYALDRAGAVVGVCRTKFHKPNGPGSQDDTPGDFDLEVFDILGQRKVTETQATFLRKVDSFGRTTLASSVANNPVRYMHCYRMGASYRNDHLVMYLQPQGFEDSPKDFAIEFRVLNNSFAITDFEIFDRAGAPSSVIARDNPLKGHSVNIVGGVIQIDGSDVVENGSPVKADSVKHRFQ